VSLGGVSDILVAQPQGESDQPPEESCGRFFEKSRDVRDSWVPNGEKGRVVDVRVYREQGDELPPGANMVASVCSTEA